MIAAKLSFTEMTSLMEKMPAYSAYRTEHHAADAERIFRRALGMMLKECGDHLLNVVERKAQILSSEHEHLIDSLVDRIGLIFRRLDREGEVCLVGNCDRTINELEECRHILVMQFDEHKDYQDALKTRLFSASGQRIRIEQLVFKQLSTNLAHKLWQHRVLPVQMKQNGPSMLVSETILPFESFIEYQKMLRP